jgi:hypothetical protein
MRTEAPLTLWGTAQETAARLPWSWALERIQATEDYWLVTTGPRGPAPRPVWGLWIDEHLLLSVGSTTHWRNLETSDRVAVHLGDTHEVIVIEGTARRETDEHALSSMVEPYNQKYNWNWKPDEPYGPFLAVYPNVVLAWTAAPTQQAQSEPFPMAAGKWRFAPPS